MGKIDAAVLNKKDVQQVVRKITGGCKGLRPEAF